MLANYIITAWRHIVNNRMFAAINVLGLALGFLSCILIMLFVMDELSYDRWLTHSDRIVRLHTGFYTPDRPPFETVRSAGRMMEAVSQFAPEQVETGVRLVNGGFTLLNEDKVFAEQLTFADGSFFSVFDLPFLFGDKETSFSKPMDFLMTESQAIKHFGRTDVVGELITVCCVDDQRVTVQITGVIKDLPENTHLALDILVYLEPSMFDSMPNILNTWTSVNTYTYFKLKPGVSIDELQERITYWMDNESPFLSMIDEGETPSERLKLKLMSLLDLHLEAIKDSGSMGDMKPLGNKNTVLAFVAIAIVILVIACMNFVNLSTARASMRAREVAMRKVMGASRRQVIIQFLGEAVIVVLFSVLVALAAVDLALPVYADAVDKNLSTDVFETPLGFAILGSVALLVGVLSGAYPALYLSRFRPVQTLTSSRSASQGQTNVRSTLVVVQFAATIFLAACTLVIYGQTLYARSMDVGYEYRDKLVVQGLNVSEARQVREALVDELSKIEGVRSVTLASEVPSQDRENNTGFRLLNPPDGARSDGVIFNYHTVGFGFMEAYDMKLRAGRFLNDVYTTDTVRPVAEGEVGVASIVINEAAARQLGFVSPELAVGQVLQAGVLRSGDQNLTIVGVVEDVYFRSLKFSVRPSVYFYQPDLIRSATLNIDSRQLSSISIAVDRVWRKLVPDTPMNREFLVDMVHAQYEAEESQAQLFAVFALLALMIGCLGLYGLAAFTAERRTREIGIRKVMGAGVRDIIRLLVWQFSLPVLIANVIAWPLACYAMYQWLQGFSYRIDTSFILLAALIAGSVALLISWVTVATRALKVATNNPIHSLRYE